MTINSQSVLKAIRFACLPTISVLFMLFFAFFSISGAWTFITSNEVFAILLRIGIFIAEVALIIKLYFKYEEQRKVDEELAKEVQRDADRKASINEVIPVDGLNLKEGARVSYDTEVRRLNASWHYNDGFTAYKTADPNIMIVIKQNRN